jgi:NhaA family Na+:H+ antiporter
MSSRGRPETRSWLASERPVPRLLARPLREFLDTESAGGLVLLAATAIALLWANSPLSASYDSLWATELSVRVGPYELALDLRHWINDALMAIFFFVVGLEIKRELVVGELNTAKKAALPAVAALGGMVVPAVIYLALNAGSPGARGWGIPMATDIAFAVGILALLGGRVDPPLKVFLLSLAIADDIGAILVIALFYAGGVTVPGLLVAIAFLLAILGLRRIRVTWLPLYLLLGIGLWLATLSSGIHPTIAGVALGLLAPARPLTRDSEDAVALDGHEDGVTAEAVTAFKLRAQERVAVTERLALALHPWTGFVVIPLFALANAGVSLRPTGAEGFSWAVTVGVVAGLVIGKPLGITLFAWVGSRLGMVDLPEGVRWREITGVSALAGIGFTISLFIANLAFSDPGLVEAAKIGILAGSLLASLLGGAILLRHARQGR